MNQITVSSLVRTSVQGSLSHRGEADPSARSEDQQRAEEKLFSPNFHIKSKLNMTCSSENYYLVLGVSHQSSAVLVFLSISVEDSRRTSSFREDED